MTALRSLTLQFSDYRCLLNLSYRQREEYQDLTEGRGALFCRNF
jgi:hypothetical protein